MASRSGGGGSTHGLRSGPGVSLGRGVTLWVQDTIPARISLPFQASAGNCGCLFFSGRV